MRRIAQTAEMNGCCTSWMRIVGWCAVYCLFFWDGGSTALAQLRERVSAASEDPHPCPRCRVRAQDQIWLVSSRHLPYEGNGCDCLGGRGPNLKYYRYDSQSGWSASSGQSFFSNQDPRLVTTVYVHGNRITHDWAKDHGFTVYCRLTQCACDQRPIRHVIWSWPSDPIRCGARIVKDARIKSCRTTSQSYYLGWWLAQMSSEQRVSLMGFSYGGRAILGALQLVGGGELAGCSLPGSASQRVHPRVALWASASESCSLCTGGHHARAISQLDRGLIIFNPNDPALKRFQRVVPGAHSSALGSIGVPACFHAKGKLWQINAGQMIGKVHRFQAYMDAARLVSQVREFALWPNTSYVAAQKTQPNSTAQSIHLAPIQMPEAPVTELPTFDLAVEYLNQQTIKLVEDVDTVETATVDTELR